MSAGLQVYTTNGILQIDETYRNMFLLEKITVTTYSSTPLTVTPTAVVTPTTTVPCVVAISSSSAATAWRVSSTGSFNVASIQNNVQVTVYFFGQKDLSSSAGYGLEVFNGSGNLVFSSNYLPMKVAGIASVPNGNSSATISGLPEGSYAAMLSHQRYSFVPDLDAATTYALEDVVSSTSTSVSVSHGTTRRFSYTNSPPASQSVGGILLAIDVTHY